MSLQSRPDGSLEGEFVVRSTDPGCASNRPVTFTRTGNVRGEGLGRRSRNPARPGGITGPSAARPVPGGRHLQGRQPQRRRELRHLDVLPSHRRPLPQLLATRTTQDSRLHKTSGSWPTGPRTHTCKNGGPAHREITAAVPTAPPAQDPITTAHRERALHGHRRLPFNSDFDSRVERTGD